MAATGAIALPAASSTAATAGLPSSAAGFRLSGNYSNAEIFPNLETALRIARTHAILVISQGWQLGYEGATWDGTVADTFLDEMKAANPQLRIFRYLNAVYDSHANFPEGWYMHDGAGHRLFNTMYGNFLMDPRSTTAFTENGVTSNGWVEQLANWFRKDVARFPGVFNGGVWLDDVGGRPHVVDVVTHQPAEAVESSSGATWSTKEWYALTSSVAARLDKSVGGTTFANALLSSNCYFTGCGGSVPTKAFFDTGALRGGMAEAWLRGWYDPFPHFPSAAAWKQNVQLLIDADRRNHVIQVLTAVPAGAPNEQVAQWRLYSFASFLLGNEGSSYFQFSPYGLPKNSFEMANPLYSVDIGSPLENATRVHAYARDRGRYFERDYSNGKVFVNPTPSAVTVRLDKPYALPDGAQTQQLALGAHSGAVVLGRPGPRRAHAGAGHRSGQAAHRQHRRHRHTHRHAASVWRLAAGGR